MPIVRKSLVFAFMVLFAGCAGAPVPPVRLDTAGVAPAANYEDLAFVLTTATNDKGYLDYDVLKNDANRLEAQLKRLAVTGPTATPALFPTYESRLAYWYNARAAWAIRLALDADCPRDSLAPARLEERGFPLDGRGMTLDQIDALLLRSFDWREAAAAPCVRLHRPRLPRKPFAPDDVKADAIARLKEYLADDDRFVIDVDSKTIFYPPALWAVRGRLIEEYGRQYHTQGTTLNTALLPYAGRIGELRLQSAIGYAEACDSRDGPLACLKH
jgi:hypothetical protein